MATERASEPSVLRLSRYHCLLGELMGMRASRRVTSRELAEELGLSEETVRHDLHHVNVEGRPGAGYNMRELYEALQSYLELSEAHPFAVVGSIDMLRGLAVTFPAASFGLSVGAYFSERPEDVGEEVDGVRVHALADASSVLSGGEISVAMVASAPETAERVLDALAAAGVRGALMLTPLLRPYRPECMDVTYFRMPCALKSLAAAHPLDFAGRDCCFEKE